MRDLYLFFVLSLLIHASAFSQTTFSEETKKYIAYHETDFAFQNALLIDGTGSAARPNQTVIIKNGKIIWIDDDSKTKLPKGIKTIDLKGKALLPGWVMLHEHLFMPDFSSDPPFRSTRPMPITFPRLYLACGATTIRTAGSVAPFVDLQIKREIENGNLPGPKIDLTSPFLNHAPIKTKEEGAAFVAYWADQGFTSFKGHATVTKAVLQGAIEAAHQRNLKVTGHLTRVTFREAAEMNIDQLEHGFIVSTDFLPDKKENEMASEDAVHQSLIALDLDSELVKKFMNALIEKNIAITSTLAIWEGLTTTQPSPDPNLLSMMAPDSRDYYLRRYARTMSLPALTTMDLAYRKNAKMEKMFAALGGLLTVGTDPTGNGGIIAGFSSQRAIELLVELDGFTPLEAIKIATLNGAKSLDMDTSIGSIEVGKNADLIVIDGDPSKDVRSIRNILYVFRDGVGFDSKKLIESVRGRVGFD